MAETRGLCMDALKKFKEMGGDKMRSVVFEIAVFGRGAVAINDPKETYTLKSLPGIYSGFQLASLMYVGVKLINPSPDGGINLIR